MLSIAKLVIEIELGKRRKMNTTEQEIPTKAVEMFSKGIAEVYKDAREKAPKLENPKYGYFNKKNAAIYLGVSFPTLAKWVTKYNIPYTSVDGVRRFDKSDLDEFMKKHKKWAR